MKDRIDHTNYCLKEETLLLEGPNDSLDDVLPLEDLDSASGKTVEPPFDLQAAPVTPEAKKPSTGSQEPTKPSGLNDARLSYPKREEDPFKVFAGFRVHILGGAFHFDVVRMFARYGWKRAETVEDADLVVFIGGADVSPYLYQQSLMSVTSCDPERDRAEMKVFEECQKLKVPMFGICRGLQFLHVCNNGELWQDVDSHGGVGHDIVDNKTKEVLRVTSIHHQMIMPGAMSMVPIAVTPKRITHHFACHEMMITFPGGKKVVQDGDARVMYEDGSEEPEIEAAYYPQTMSLGVQGHPEIGTPLFQGWSMAKIADMFFENGIDNPKDG